MKKARIAAIGGASIIALVALLLAYPAMAATNNSAPLGGYPLTGTALADTASSSSSIVPTPTAMTVGQTITFVSTNGEYKTVGGSSSASGASGAASGTIVLTVTGAFKSGYALSLTSGSLTLASASATPVSSTSTTTASTTSTSSSTTYTIASGSAEMGPFEAHLVGQGTLASSTPGSFLFAAGAHANFQGNTYDTLRLDVQVNGVEYGLLLLVTSTVS